MPPIHLIQWGHPGTEEPELSNIIESWHIRGHTFNNQQLVVDTPDLNELQNAIRYAFEDLSSQVIFFSCHGSIDGFHFSNDCNSALLTYDTFRSWLSTMQPTGSPEFILPPTKWIVFGSCHTMEPNVRIEFLMPNWITRVVGFRGCPSPTDVVDLFTGFIINFVENSTAISDAMHNAAHNSFDQGVDFQVQEIQRAIITGSETFQDAPTRDVAFNMIPEIINAERDPNTFTWNRTYYRNRQS